MIIRRYIPSDYDQVFALHLKALNTQYNAKWDYDFEDLERIYIKNGGEFLVGLLNNKIVAMGALKKISPTLAELKRMRVNKKFQRQGLGQQIYNVLEKKARELGFTTIKLDTSVNQIAAQKFYQKNGFVEMRRETKGWPVEMIFYEKKIK